MDLDQKIIRLEQQLTQDDSALQKIAETFSEEATRYLRRWWIGEIERAVKRSPAVTRAHGPDRLQDLKAAAETLRDHVDEVVAASISDPAVWWHTRPLADRDEADRYPFRSESVGPKKLDAALRIAMGAVAPILLTFGYLEPARSVQWADGYPYTFRWPSELMETARSYTKRVRLATNRLHELRMHQRQRDAAGPGALW